MTTKICIDCNEQKPLNLFYKRASSKDGHRNNCKECVKLKTKQKYNENKEHALSYAKNYRDNNKESIKTYLENYRKENREKNIKYQAEYREENASTLSIKAKQYRERNKLKLSDSKKIYNQTENAKLLKRNAENKRRALKLSSADGTVTKESLKALMDRQEKKCFYCKKDIDINIKHSVHLDHYIPLSKGGKHSISNVVWSCAKCNLSKQSSIPKKELII